MKLRLIGPSAAAALLSLLATLPAGANGDPTATPTATGAVPICTRTPPPAGQDCGSARVRLGWTSKRPDFVTVSISATHCPAPAACAGAPAFSAVTTAPARVEISDSACHALSASFTDPALNTTGCPGRDFYKADVAKLRLVYGAATTAIASIRVPLAQPGVPALTPPLRFTIRDAAGYAIERTLGTCFVKQSDTSLKMKCF